jgi:hypothetical protein
MRKFALFASALLAGCTTTAPTDSPGPPQPTPIHGVTPGHKCDAAGTERFVGQPGTSETGAEIMRATHAAVLRWAPVGYMLTMDFREDRVTVHLGADRKVTEIKCG